MPIAQVVRNVKVSDLLDPLALVWPVLAGLMTYGYNRSQWAQYRMLLLTAGILLPAIVLGVNFVGSVLLLLASPFRAVPILYEAFAGKADGEFYNEGMLIWAAIGLWIAFCGALVIRECGRGLNEFRVALEPERGGASTKH
jgi:hypothetical protein